MGIFCYALLILHIDDLVFDDDLGRQWIWT